ncbi:DUF2252 family protein [Herbaspirillum sp. YR522]|uniref:DUF2252 family protein n=1 Tax=Herbaspirillum sp. YR522 TaxID=1144342 RepID=UPI00026FCDAE|nr:DUF2252 family protein [Herbaspirillum sp. YR522]EJM97549.1 hypothetical protein PMI40_04310 [Herbaspirillum sp. YR522]
MPKKLIKVVPRPSDRHDLLATAKKLKMARSAQAYVRGSTLRFYEWLNETAPSNLPEGPAIWICGDCHIGNLGPVASADGRIQIQIRDFDQTVIGNPTHDLIRLALSLAMAARSSDLPGVITAKLMEVLVQGYESAFQSGAQDETGKKPESVRIALKSAHRRTWRELAKERIEGKTVRIPLGKRFWPASKHERQVIGELFRSSDARELVTAMRHRANNAEVKMLDTAYWMKGCSSLGYLRFAVLLDANGQATERSDICLFDIKEAVTAAAPRYADARMPRDNADRVVEGARHLSPHLGTRMKSARILERPVFMRELLPQDLKLEIDHVSQAEALRAARYLARVVGLAHAGQMDQPTRAAWSAELARYRSKTLEVPSWLWSSVVDLVASHERAYLEHCRRYALADQPIEF